MGSLFDSVQTSNIKKLQFSTQVGVVTEVPQTYATLKSGTKGVSITKTFTICCSIYIGYFRTRPAFFTMRADGKVKLWFSLFISEQDILTNIYSVNFQYYDSSVMSSRTPGKELFLRPHAWSHACTAVNANTGNVTVVITGIVTHDVVIKSKEFLANTGVSLEKNLVLGIRQVDGSANTITQSEASVTNLNIFSGFLNVSKMVSLTTTGKCKDGDVLSWIDAQWDFTGSVESLTEDFCKEEKFPEMYIFSHGFEKWTDCIHFCPKIHSSGRVPLPSDVSNSALLANEFENNTKPSSNWVWASFHQSTDGTFIDHFSGTPMPNTAWLPGQPNAGKGQPQPCTFWKGVEGKVCDYSCNVATPMHCICQFHKSPIIKLRGFCKGSDVDTHYTPRYVNGGVEFLGLTTSLISFDGKHITLKTRNKNFMRLFSVRSISYLIGKRKWTGMSASRGKIECEMRKDYKVPLKMSGCADDKFTCSNGDCITMEERCDQVIDCRDESDEVNCRILVLKDSYSKSAPPTTSSWENNTRTVSSASVKVSFTIRDISGIREQDNEIDIAFTAEFQWTDSRAIFHNLKRGEWAKGKVQNKLDLVDLEKMWIPDILYENNKDRFNIRTARTQSKVAIERRGNFTLSSLDVVDEIEIFKGSDNPIIMVQSYTKTFQCKFKLKAFPFDKQVIARKYIKTEIN